jgi:hypothetical protein
MVLVGHHVTTAAWYTCTGPPLPGHPTGLPGVPPRRRLPDPGALQGTVTERRRAQRRDAGPCSYPSPRARRHCDGDSRGRPGCRVFSDNTRGPQCTYRYTGVRTHTCALFQSDSCDITYHGHGVPVSNVFVNVYHVVPMVRTNNIISKTTRNTRETRGRCQHGRQHGILRFKLDSEVCRAYLHHNPRKARAPAPASPPLGRSRRSSASAGSMGTCSPGSARELLECRPKSRSQGTRMYGPYYDATSRYM